MNTSQSNPEFTKVPQRVWRRHSAEFKASVMEQARQAHVSVAAVALANGINANMLRRWLRESFTPGAARIARADGIPAPEFVQLPVPTPKPALPGSASSEAVEVQIHRGQTRVVLNLALGSNSAVWLREVLA